MINKMNENNKIYETNEQFFISCPGDMSGGADMSILGSPPSSTVLALSSTYPLFGIPVSKPTSPTSNDVKGKGRKPSTPMSYMDHLMSPDQELNEPQPDVQPSECFLVYFFGFFTCRILDTPSPIVVYRLWP